MKVHENYPKDCADIPGEKARERTFWLNKLSGSLKKINFPYDNWGKSLNKKNFQQLTFELPDETRAKLLRISGDSDHTLNAVLVAGLMVLLEKYSGSSDVTIGTPIYRQDIDAEFINTLLILRTHLEGNMTFKKLLLQVGQTIVEATDHYHYPMETLLKDLNMPIAGEEDFPLFDVATLLENIHDRNYIQHINRNMTFSFSKTEESISGLIEYNSLLYNKKTIERISVHFNNVLRLALSNPGRQISHLDILTDQEKEWIIYEFNHTETEYPEHQTIHELFEQQVEQRPDNIALVYGNQHLSYKTLNEKANQVMQRLKSQGVGQDTIAAIMMERSIEMIIGILGILKAGGAYLPMDVENPKKRTKYMMDDSSVPVLITDTHAIKDYSFMELQNLKASGNKLKIFRTPVREQIKDLEKMLPIPDRSLIDYEKYSKNIGMAMAKHTIAVQASRGCPYKCIYCHKIWPKTHVFRSAEHIFDEVQLFYHMGVRRFVIVDDIFNLNKENSSRFFKLIIKNKLKVQLFFPNGMRGDILTKDYIDLMMEAGTINLALALETASPRLQRWIGKNLNIDKLHENMVYICQKHPHVISELFTMHGFPTETESEAQTTMAFIKSLKWLHLPHVNILKIYPNTDMADFAIKNGISPEAIARSENLAFHQLPETLPFDESFTMKYQADYLDYFLSKERLLHVLPYQMKALTRSEMLQKYNSFLPAEINRLEDLLQLADISPEELDSKEFLPEDCMKAPDLNRKMNQHFAPLTPQKGKDALRILLMDLSQFFSGEWEMLYDVSEPPLGLMYLMTHLNKIYGSRVRGKVIKSRTDFNSFKELKTLMEDFQPEIIGIRTLTFFNHFFHKTVAMIRDWGFDAPIIAGGPYATSDYKRILRDRNIDLVVLGEGEFTLSELVGKILKNNKELPQEEILKKIAGIALVPKSEKQKSEMGRGIILMDQLLAQSSANKPTRMNQPANLAYTMYTSGSTGQPKGVLVEHQNVIRLVKNTTFMTFKEDDHLLQTAPLEFDASTLEIWGPLLNGSTLYLTNKHQILTAERLKDAVTRYGIDTMWMSSPLFNQMLDLDIQIFRGLKHLVVGGDALSPLHINRTRKQFPRLNVINGYGPTENTTFSLTHLVSRDYQNNIPIGKPISNSTAYILSKTGNLLPVGAVGELYVGGHGVSRGYLNNPELTAEKFVELAADALIHDGRFRPENNKSKRLYKTGDLARWLPCGNIEFIGRIDNQVKIRGYRIELSEIETHLLKLDNIEEAILDIRETQMGDKQICAYVVANTDDFLASDLRDYLMMHLPEFMIPSHFVRLDHIPLNSRGKVDRKLLSAPEIETARDYIAPGNEIEEKLVEIWSEILEVKKEAVGINSDFFELGAHSLKSTILVSRIHKEFNVKMPLEEIFATPFVKDLARYIKEARENKFTPIDVVEEKEYYPLSSAQKRLYILQQLETSLTNYNIPTAIIIEGDLDRIRLKETFVKLIQRHESLRTSFPMVDEEPAQKIHKEIDFAIEYYENAENNSTEIMKSFIKIFDLNEVPLMRVGLIKQREYHHILMVDMHHIITDGTSMGVFLKEFMALFAGKELSPLKVQYKDFAQWQNNLLKSAEIEKQEKYWVKQFKEEIPVLNLPIDFARPVAQSFEGSSVTFKIGKHQAQALKSLAAGEDATLFMVLQAIFYVFLAKISGNEDIVVGTVVAGRKHSDMEQIIGMFVNTMALRNYPLGHKSFSRFLKEVKKNTLSAFENQDYQFETLVGQLSIRRDISRNPLFDVMFTLQNMNIPELEIPGLKLKHYNKESGIPVFDRVKFDMTLNGEETGEYLSFTWEYCTKLFKKETIQRFIQYFTTILVDVLHDPGKKISEIQWVSEDDKRRVLYDFNHNKKQHTPGRLLHQLFEEQAEKRADNIALIYQNHRLTYRQFNERANQLAHFLRDKGVKKNSLVGVLLERSIEMIVGVLAILKAGGAYLPLDTGYPEKRLNYIYKDSQIKLLLRDGSLSETTAGNCEAVDLMQPGLYNGVNTNLETINTPRDLAYAIYTSGSTGEPKGVLIEQHSVLSILLALQARYPLEETDVYLLKTSYVFDVSVTELFGWFLGGGRLSILRPGEEKVPETTADNIQRNRISHINFVPTMFNAFLEYLTPQNMCKISYLKYIFLAGEAVLPQMVNKFKSLQTGCQLENIYGPTEATIYASWYPLADWDGVGNIPIGKPVTNGELYILDKYDKLQPLTVWGELHVGGGGLARGYLNQPEQTSEKFIGNPFQQSQRLYRTGDLARWRTDGSVEFAGRRDSQVKIRGYRIETGEIESQLLKHEDIKEVVVIMKEDKKGNKYLCAYIVPESAKKADLDISSLRKYLLSRLPTYMIPAYFKFMERLPLTAGGKIDRLSLPLPEPVRETYRIPEGQIEMKLAEIWQNVLGIEHIGVEDNFFEIGGDSIKIIQIAARLNKYGFEVKINDFFSNPTIKQLKKYIQVTRREIDQGIVTGEVKLTPIQQWFFEKNFKNLHHFNQSVMLYHKDGFNDAFVKKAFSKIVEHHDALRMIYEISENKVNQSIKGIDKGFDFEQVHLPDLNEKDLQEEIEMKANRAQEGIDLNAGPLVKLVLFKTQAGDHLLIIIHHLVIDGISWRILIEDFKTAYYQLESKEEIILPQKTDSFKYWSNWLNQYASIKEAVKELEYWQTVEAVKVERLPKDHEIGKEKKKYKNTETKSFDLGEKETGMLLRQVHQAYNTEINDILLSALGMAVKDWAGIGTLVINMEGHGRESLSDSVNIGRTVGWFTSQYPVVLDMSKSQDLSHHIKHIKETLRHVPRKGIGYGILKYLTPVQKKDGQSFELEPEISFNYLGQFIPSLEKQSEPINISRMPTGKNINPEFNGNASLHVNGIVVDGKLNLSISYNKYEYNQINIAKLQDGFKAYLREIIVHCSQKEKCEPTPSDLGCNHLSLKELAALNNYIKSNIGQEMEIQELYPLTPMQKGMLYHVLKHEESTAYFEQCEFTLEGEINKTLLEQSYNILLERYDVLRTIFIYENLKEPMQLVLKAREMHITDDDTSSLSENEKTRFLEKFKKNDCNNGFDLSRDLLMRIHQFRTAPGSYCLLWSFHHILMDGWCMGIIFNDLIRVYCSLKNGKSPILGDVQPYKNYIIWLEKQDKEESGRYWQKYLEGYEQTAVLPKLPGDAVVDNNNELEIRTYILDENLSADLRKIGKKNQVTMATVFLSLWGILLQKYNNCDDVVFGTIVLGRPPQLEGIEGMVGLFINAVPLRIKTAGDKNFPGLLQDVHHNAILSKSHEYLPLAEIQSKTPLKMNLIDHLLVYEDYLIKEEIANADVEQKLGFKIKKIKMKENTNYHLNIGIMPGKCFMIKIGFNNLMYHPEVMEKIGLHFLEIIKQVVKNSEIKIKEIEISHDFLVAQPNIPGKTWNEWVLE